MRPTLVLRHGRRRLLLTQGAVAIGRLEECDVALEGTAISRRHARIVATPEGPLLVDRSRFGTWLNGAQVVAPSRLEAGDVILIGTYDLYIEYGEPAGSKAEGGIRRRLAFWRRRFGVAEVCGGIALILAALLVQRISGSILLAALAGSLTEAGWFYAVLLGREYRQEQASARLGGCVPRPLRELLRDLLLEFGAAERVDSLLIRPLCLAAGLAWVGSWPGLLAGKIVADVLFYGPVLSLLHWRDANRGGTNKGSGEQRLRKTTASNLPPLAL